MLYSLKYWVGGGRGFRCIIVLKYTKLVYHVYLKLLVWRPQTTIFTGEHPTDFNGPTNLNALAEYDLNNCINQYLGPDPDTNLYINLNFSDGYLDLSQLILKFKNKSQPLFLSLNIQSLNSKFNALKDLVEELTKNGINLAVIALQEIWNLPHPDLLKIQNFQLYFKQRTSSRGGGVGFYINKNIPAKINWDLSPFTEKVFECLTVEVMLNNKKSYLTNFYRPPYSDAETVRFFLDQFDALLSNLHRNDNTYFIFCDANINLLNINSCLTTQNYLSTVHSNGFLNGISKATRIQNLNFSLIDHIFCKNEPHNLSFNVITSDISDHFITAVSYPDAKNNNKPSATLSRNFSTANKISFRNTLNALSWTNVYDCDNANLAFNQFFDTFKDFFDIYFPLEPKKRPNKNVSAINDFMTNGLLISRLNKDRLHKKYLTTRSVENLNNYKNYRNIYNSILKASKKLSIGKKLILYKQKPKKVWQIYNELTSGNKINNDIVELNINGNLTSDKKILQTILTFSSLLSEKTLLVAYLKQS